MIYIIEGIITECSDFSKAGLQFTNKFPFASAGIVTLGRHAIEVEGEENMEVTAYVEDGENLVIEELKYSVKDV